MHSVVRSTGRRVMSNSKLFLHVPFRNQMMREPKLDDRVILYILEKPSYLRSYFCCLHLVESGMNPYLKN